jgi:ribonuclease R
MLPQELSNGICSLNEGVDRLCLSAVMDIDKSGKAVKHKITEGVIRSAHRMTYNNVAKILDGDTELCARYADLIPMLNLMKELAHILFSKRVRRGTVEFDLPECEVILDENGKTVDIRKHPRLLSHRIIEEFMLAANETVAESMYNLKSPFVYRSHEAPSSEKIEALKDFLGSLAIQFELKGDKPMPLDFANLLEGIDENLKSVVNRVALRSMSKAAYEPISIGHFGLAAEFYCHFTSPIRRYPDLMIHRIIKDYLKNGKQAFDKYRALTEEVSARSSERERGAERAERDVDDLKKAEFMADKIGESFEGIVSGVTEWGLFVELDNSVEGLIRTERLPGDSYLYNPKNLSLSNGASFFKIGDRLAVTVESVNKDKIAFILKAE